MEHCISPDAKCDKCQYFEVDDCGTLIFNDALELLKEQEPLKKQEPHVLTIEEIEDSLDTVVWVDRPGIENTADQYALIMTYSRKYGFVVFDSPFKDNTSQDRFERFEYDAYGKTWRCWDKRPTYEQRKAVKWDATEG